MREEQVNWRKFRRDLIASLSNERLWSLECTMDEDNPHLVNIEDLEEEIAAIDHSDFDMILEKHQEFPEFFDDYLLPETVGFPADSEALYNEILLIMPSSLFPYSNDESAFKKQAEDEFKVLSYMVCKKFDIEAEWERMISDLASPFNPVRDDIIKEILKRIKANPLNQYDPSRMKEMENQELYYLVFDDNTESQKILKQFQSLGFTPYDEGGCGWLDEEFIKEHSHGRILVCNHTDLVEIDEYEHKEQLEGEYGVVDSELIPTYKLCDLLRYHLGLK